MPDDTLDQSADATLAGDQKNNVGTPPDVLRPFRVGFHDKFAPDPSRPQIAGSIASMEAGMERISETQDLAVKKGNTVVLYAGASDPAHNFKFGDFYSRIALAQEKGSPIDLDERSGLKISDYKISFRFPDRNFAGDKFWVLLSGRNGIRPIILKATLVLKTAEQEVEEQRQKVEAEKRRAEEAQKQSSSTRQKTGGNLVMDITHGIMGGITGAVKEGVIMGMSQGGQQAKTPSDSRKALNKTLTTWKNEYNRPGTESVLASEADSDTSAEIQTGAGAKVAGEAEVVVPQAQAQVVVPGSQAQASVTAAISSRLSSFSAEQRESIQSVAADISQKTYANLKSSVSVSVTNEASYQEARTEILETLQKERGEAYVSSLTPQQIHEVTLRTLSAAYPGVVEQYRSGNKVYGEAAQDPIVQNMHGEIDVQIETYLNQVQVAEDKQPELRLFLRDEIGKQVWQQFAKDFPEKAAAYQNQIPQLQQAINEQNNPLSSSPFPQAPVAEPQSLAGPVGPGAASPQTAESISSRGQPTTGQLPDGPAPQEQPVAKEPLLPPAEKPQPQTPEQQEAARQVGRLRERAKKMDDIARRTADHPKKQDVAAGKQSNVPAQSQQNLDENTASQPMQGGVPVEKAGSGRIEPGQPAEPNLPAPLKIPGEKINSEPQPPEQSGQLPQGQAQPELPGQLPEPPVTPPPAAPAVNAVKAAAGAAEKAEAIAKTVGTVAKITAFLAEYWWVILIAIGIFFLIVGIIAFLIKGCEKLHDYHLDQIMGGRLCEIADAFKNGGLSAGVREIASPTIAPGGPINVSQWRPQIISAANANGLPNACILTTIVAKESGGNKNAVSSTCSFDTMRGYDVTQHSPPLYDLNWNCGHAFGLTQIYIYPQNGAARWQDNSTPSRFLFNHYYTIPELLDADTNLSLGARYFALLLNTNSNINLSAYAQGLSPEDQQVWKSYRRYNGSGTAAENYADDSMRRYQTCKTTGY